MSLIILIIVAIVIGLVVWTRMLARSAEQIVPMAGRLHAVPGGAVHYLDLGPRDAQTLVLVHGLAGVMQHFTYALSDDLAKDFRVVVVDRPGCGYSTFDNSESTGLVDQARMVGALLDDLGIQNPVLVGHSMGGALSLAMAMDRPGKVAALALLAPLTQVENMPTDVFKPMVINSGFVRRLIGNTLAVPMAKFTSGKVLAEVFKPEPAPEDFLVRGGGGLGLRPQAFVSASTDLTESPQTMAGLTARYAKELKVPGGVLFGDDDALLSAQVHGRVMQDFGLEYQELPERGHMILITAPDDCAGFIRRMAAKATR